MASAAPSWLWIPFQRGMGQGWRVRLSEPPDPPPLPCASGCPASDRWVLWSSSYPHLYWRVRCEDAVCLAPCWILTMLLPLSLWYHIRQVPCPTADHVHISSWLYGRCPIGDGACVGQVHLSGRSRKSGFSRRPGCDPAIAFRTRTTLSHSQHTVIFKIAILHLMVSLSS